MNVKAATALSDAVVGHLAKVADEPDLFATKYDLREMLGRGGMGTVYRAFDRELGRDVALKVLAIEDSKEWPEGRDRLVREARIVARLEHPGIVPVHDVGTLPDGRVYYAMKLVRGERLDAHLGPSLSRSERLAIFERICDAVAFAHAHGVMHRDLKPENVMVGPFGEVLVLDWGVAKFLPGFTVEAPELGGGQRDRGDLEEAPGPNRRVPTAHGTVLGTPGYMAPEQERGEVDRVDERADIYALGGILAFLLRTGEADIPKALRAIRDKALANDRAQRYQTVVELAADLARFRAGDAVFAHRENPLERAARFAKRHKTPIALVLAYLVMRAVLIVAMRR